MPDRPISQISSSSNRRVCAIVVAYYPDPAFGSRLETILSQVDALLVVDNTPTGVREQRLAGLMRGNEAKLKIFTNPQNLGIAVALNQGLDHALSIGSNWILTLDQDTQCFPDMLDTLINTYEACELKPSVIGSNYVDPQLGKLAVSDTGGSLCMDSKTVITSGTLIDAKSAHAAGGFREDFFIDQVDHEFCLRMRAFGHRVVISAKPAMTHSVGSLGGVSLPFFGSLPNHPPLRKYYIARNSIVTITEYWRQEPGWCLRRLTRLALGLLFMATLEKQRFAKVRAFTFGIVDGLYRHMGACQRAWLISTDKIQD